MMENLGGSSKGSKSSSCDNTTSVIIPHVFTYDIEKFLDKEKSVHSRAFKLQRRLWQMRHVLKDTGIGSL